jgi:galactose mutarotase-like enzyme
MSFADSKATRDLYPFSFVVRINYQLYENHLFVSYSVKNTGNKTMPFSIGSHYTYRLPSQQKECYYLFSKTQNALSYTQKDGIIGLKENHCCFKDNLIPMDNLFDKASKIFEVSELDTDYIAICDKKGIFTKVEFYGFSYVVLWAPKGNNSPFACIEPWAGMADFQSHDLNICHKKGIIMLKANEEKSFLQIITIY